MIQPEGVVVQLFTKFNCVHILAIHSFGRMVTRTTLFAEILHISLYSARMPENKDQNNSE